MVPTWKPQYRELERSEQTDRQDIKRWALPDWTRDDDDDDIKVEERSFFNRVKLRKKGNGGPLSSTSRSLIKTTLLARQDDGGSPPPPPPPPPQTTEIPSGSESEDDSNSSSESSQPPAPTRPPPPPIAPQVPPTQVPSLTVPEDEMSSSAPMMSLPSQVLTGIEEPRSTTLVPPPSPTSTSSITSTTTTTSTTESLVTSSTIPSPKFESIANSPVLSTHLAHVTVGATSTSSSDYAKESGYREQVENPPPYGRHHEPSPAEKAVHILGAIGGVFFIAGLLWFAWRAMRASRAAKKQGRKPSAREIVGFAVPFLKDNSMQSNRSNPDNAYPTALEEKQMAEDAQRNTYMDAKMYSEYMRANQSSGSITTLPPAYVEKSRLQYLTDNILSRNEPNQTLFSNAADYSLGNTLRTEGPFASKRTSQVSSLSSAFGDQDIIIPPSAESTLREQQMIRDEVLNRIEPPAAARNRESLASRMSRITFYTETSEDSPPRFRTVNSWVRQQTGRIKRQNKRAEEEDVPPVPNLPAEPEFRMMMPDGEEPRRVDVNQVDPGPYGMPRR